MGNSYSGQRSTPLEEKRKKNFKEEEDEIKKRALESLDTSDTNDDAVEETDSGQCDPRSYVYPFENLIFEGGGNKGLAFGGAIKCLEEMNIMPQIKRVAGSSAGAITAALLAVGYNSKEIEVLMADNLEYNFLDHSCGYLSLVPNLLTGWGWNPGHRIYNWLGDKIKDRTGSPDLTFFELYKQRNIELCVVVTNLNLMRTEYCHPKTTPDMTIREALRMSMSIPIMFMACAHDNFGQTDTYVDGGVLCNYPIHCFDGWLLSMDTKDSFLLRMQKLDDLSQFYSSFINRESELNMKSLGFLVYEDTEVEVMKNSLGQRKGSEKPLKPSKEAKLYKEKLAAKNILFGFKEARERCLKSAENFMKVLLKHNIEDQIHIDKNELRKALEDGEFSSDDRATLFGKNVTLDEGFDYLDRDKNGKIDIQELLRFLEHKNIRIQTKIQGYGRTDINSFVDFGNALQNSLIYNLKFVYVKKYDIKRTVGINTGHVGTSDFTLETEDREFLFQRGYNATLAFLKYFIEHNADKVKPKAVSEEEKKDR